ncbi:MAG TPA: TIGR03000 domain-containing protein [Gemmataceae bacterium]|nr:TIGR03000 domain-containing protein [Gemmataceae bacterium]
MYSVVMLAAMTAAPEAPDFFFKRNGCSGYSSCYGCGGGGCWSSGYGCGGCRGWSHGGWSNGCCGGCWSAGCSGCHGYASVYSGCNGYASCYGGLSLGGCISTYGPPGASCYGHHFSPGYTQAGVGFTDGMAPYYTPTVVTPATETPEAVSSLPATRAQLVVRVPADAKLFADGQATTMAGAERAFMTPEIAAGKDFQYTLKVEYTDNGEAKDDTKQVVVRAGHRTVVDFGGAAVKATTPVTVTLPEKAKLYVDGQAADATAGKQTFKTPELVKGKPYTYEFKAEVEVDGKTDVRTRTVTFVAGEPVSVDFTEAEAVRTAANK